MTTRTGSLWLRLVLSLGWTRTVSSHADTSGAAHAVTGGDGEPPLDLATTDTLSDEEAYWMAIMKYCGCCC